jgi:hypothetical protein
VTPGTVVVRFGGSLCAVEHQGALLWRDRWRLQFLPEFLHLCAKSTILFLQRIQPGVHLLELPREISGPTMSSLVPAERSGAAD